MDERKREVLDVLKPVIRALEELRQLDPSLSAALREIVDGLSGSIRVMEAVPNWPLYTNQVHTFHQMLLMAERRTRRVAALFMDAVRDALQPIPDWMEKELSGGKYVLRCDQDKSHQFILRGDGGWAFALRIPAEIEQRTGNMFSTDPATGEIRCHVCQPNWMFAGLYYEP